jgi:hypothetical protein
MEQRMADLSSQMGKRREPWVEHRHAGKTNKAPANVAGA